MNNINTGGPAFPSGLQEQSDDTVDSLHKGMTLRDYFAAKASDQDVADQLVNVKRVQKAVPGVDGITRLLWTLPDNARQIARYLHADEMLKEREA